MKSSRQRARIALVIALGTVGSLLPQVAAPADPTQAVLRAPLESDATGQEATLELDTVAPFDPEGGTVIVDGGFGAEEQIDYTSTDAETNELVGLERPDPLFHDEGASVTADSSGDTASPSPSPSLSTSAQPSPSSEVDDTSSQQESDPPSDSDPSGTEEPAPEEESGGEPAEESVSNPCEELDIDNCDDPIELIMDIVGDTDPCDGNDPWQFLCDIVDDPLVCAPAGQIICDVVNDPPVTTDPCNEGPLTVQFICEIPGTLPDECDIDPEDCDPTSIECEGETEIVCRKLSDPTCEEEGNGIPCAWLHDPDECDYLGDLYPCGPLEIPDECDYLGELPPCGPVPIDECDVLGDLYPCGPLEIPDECDYLGDLYPCGPLENPCDQSPASILCGWVNDPPIDECDYLGDLYPCGPLTLPCSGIDCIPADPCDLDPDCDPVPSGCTTDGAIGCLPALPTSDTTCGEGWAGPVSGCKYGQAKYATACGPNGCQVTQVITKLLWRGGTASGVCDPTNNYVKWRIDYITITKVSNDKERYRWGPSQYFENCDVDLITHVKRPGLTIGSTHDIAFNFRWVGEPGAGDFTDGVYRRVQIDCFAECTGLEIDCDQAACINDAPAEEFDASSQFCDATVGDEFVCTPPV